MLFKILIQFSNIVYLLYEEEDIFLPKNSILYTQKSRRKEKFHSQIQRLPLDQNELVILFRSFQSAESCQFPTTVLLVTSLYVARKNLSNVVVRATEPQSNNRRIGNSLEPKMQSSGGSLACHSYPQIVTERCRHLSLPLRLMHLKYQKKKSTTTTQGANNVDELDYCNLPRLNPIMQPTIPILSHALGVLSSDCGLTWTGVCSRADFLRSILQYPDQLTPLKNRAVAVLQKIDVLLWIQERIHANGSAQGEVSNQIGVYCVWVILPVFFRLPNKSTSVQSAWCA